VEANTIVPDGAALAYQQKFQVDKPYHFMQPSPQGRNQQQL